MTDELENQSFNFPRWPEMKKLVAERFRTKTQQEWIDIFEHLDACVSPVLERAEAGKHQHNIDSNSFMINQHDSSKGFLEPTPAPLLSRTPATCESRPQPKLGEHTIEILKSSGFSDEETNNLLEIGAVEQSTQSSKL